LCITSGAVNAHGVVVQDIGDIFVNHWLAGGRYGRTWWRKARRTIIGQCNGHKT
jgi:hypothetical protein